MKGYTAYRYYTLESKAKGLYRQKGEVVKYDTYEKAYLQIYNLYGTEDYKGEPHGYWYIRENQVVEYTDAKGQEHHNECVYYAH